ncbi:hypothetical protein E3P91_04161 [Wallemia ichthyophaga]|nr:hypothetical protein E3P91_04161 [Wallemia ichthyophaga]
MALVAAPGSHKLSSEPGNLLANHSYKYSSTINGQKALGVNPHDKGAVIVARKTKAPVNQWNKGFAKTQVTGGKRRAYKSTANVVATTRPDLVKVRRICVAILKYSHHFTRLVLSSRLHRTSLAIQANDIDKTKPQFILSIETPILRINLQFQPAVAKVSAIYASKGQKKDAPAKKVRGKKAQAPLPAPKAE